MCTLAVYDPVSDILMGVRFSCWQHAEYQAKLIREQRPDIIMLIIR